MVNIGFRKGIRGVGMNSILILFTNWSVEAADRMLNFMARERVHFDVLQPSLKEFQIEWEKNLFVHHLNLVI